MMLVFAIAVLILLAGILAAMSKDSSEAKAIGWIMSIVTVSLLSFLL